VEKSWNISCVGSERASIKRQGSRVLLCLFGTRKWTTWA